MQDKRSAQPTAAAETEEMAAMREQARNRKRRVLFNNDSGDIFYAGSTAPESFLSHWITPILGSPVDSVFYCTGATTIFSHLAKVGETYGEFVTAESGQNWINVRDNINALRDSGHDVLGVITDFCHTNGLEAIWTYRINDIHDSMPDCAPELSRWKREHPEYCMGDPGDYAAYGGYVNSTPKLWWSILDFEIPEVRDYLVAILEDVCERYDIDGVDIDYFRSPMFFRPNLDYQPATPEQVELLTGFQRRIRDVAHRAGSKRGRPILVSVRVPVTVARCMHVGIDIDQWLGQDLVDLLCISGGYVPFTMPMRELINLGHAHGVPVYPSISSSGLRNRHNALEAWRGVASNVWHAGADGFSTFNLWPDMGDNGFNLVDVANDVGDLETLAGLDKMFAIDNHPTLEGDLAQAIEDAQILPVTLESWGKPRSETLVIGDNIPAAAADKRLKSVEMRVQFDHLTQEDIVEVRLNDHMLTPCAEEDVEEGFIVYRPDPASYRQGNNSVAFRMLYRPPDATDAVVVRATEVHVKY